MSIGDVFGWGSVRQGCVWSGEMSVGEMSFRDVPAPRRICQGSARRGNFRRGCVWLGKCTSGKCPSGMCPVGEMSVGDVSVGEVYVGEISVGGESGNPYKYAPSPIVGPICKV